MNELLQWYFDSCSAGHKPSNEAADMKFQSLLSRERTTFSIREIYERSPEGQTLLDYICFCDHPNILRWLISPLLESINGKAFQSAQDIAAKEESENCLRVLSEISALIFPSRPHEARLPPARLNVCLLPNDEIFTGLYALTTSSNGRRTIALFPIYHQLLSSTEPRIIYYTRVLFDVFLCSNWRISVVVGDDVSQDPSDTKSTKTRGYADVVEKKVCIATGRETPPGGEASTAKGDRIEREVKGNVIHELTHGVCDIIWNQGALPYANGTEREQYLAACEQVRAKHMSTSSSDDLDDLIRNVFTIYGGNSDKESIELIVRIPELIVREGVPAIEKLQQQVPLLFWYYQTVFLPKCYEHLRITRTLEWLSKQLENLSAAYDEKICKFLDTSSKPIAMEKEEISFFIKQCDVLLEACDRVDFHGMYTVQDDRKVQLLIMQALSFQVLEMNDRAVASLFRVGSLHSCPEYRRDAALKIIAELKAKTFTEFMVVDQATQTNVGAAMVNEETQTDSPSV